MHSAELCRTSIFNAKNNIELINIRDGSCILIPHYLKNEFLEKNYKVLPRNTFLKKIYIFFLINFIRKILIIFTFIVENKFYLKLPPKKNVIVFDDENIEILKKIFSNEDFFILPTRINKIKTIYFVKK